MQTSKLTGFILHSGVLKRNALSLCECHALNAERMPVHCVKMW